MSNPDTADVVWLNNPRKIEIRKESLPHPHDHELLCSTIVTAISPGTEIAAFKGLPPLRPGVVYPRLQGYCNVAQVLAVGSKGSKFEPGDRVLSFISHRSAFLIAETEVLYKLPVEAHAEHIAVTYLFHLGYNAILRSGVRPGHRVLVIGLGILGLTSVAAAVLAGARTFALSNHAVPTTIAKHYGAEAVFSRNELSDLHEKLGTELADVVIVTTNGWHDWEIALKMVAQLGVIAVLGFPGRGDNDLCKNPLDSQYFYTKQIQIKAVGSSPEFRDSRGFCRFNERDNIKFLAKLIIDKNLDPKPLISGMFNGMDIESAYLKLISRESSPLTYLLKWNN